MSSRATRLLFWYVVPLSENLTPGGRKRKQCHRIFPEGLIGYCRHCKAPVLVIVCSIWLQEHEVVFWFCSLAYHSGCMLSQGTYVEILRL